MREQRRWCAISVDVANLRLDTAAMDRAVWQEYLAQAERNVVETEKRVARHREMVAELERGGHRTTAARGMLAAFERFLVMHLADCNRLRKELGGG